MRALVLDDDVRLKIHSVVAYAMAIREEPDLLVKSGYRAAIEKMGLSTDDVSNVDFLLAAPDAATRLQGVYLFSKQRPDLVATTLLAMAKNATEVEVARAAAAAAMGGAGASHRDDVAKLASDAGLPASVRAAAMRGLARIDAIGGGKVADIAADTGRSLADRRAAITALAAAGPGTSPNLRGLAGSSEAWIVAAAIDGLATVGSTEVETLDRLTQSLTAQDATERLAGMGALVRLSKAKEKRLVILPLVSDPDPRVAARAARYATRLIRRAGTTSPCFGLAPALGII